jgi:hypothetical protein
MIFVILVFCILMIIIGAKLGSDYGLIGDIGDAMSIIFGIASGIALLAILLLTISVVDNNNIDERIAMYQEENAKIEQQIDILVKDYLEYERGVFTDSNSESAITLVSLYPELKADQLVSSQIDIYVKNNENIKSLKLEKLNAEIVRWWLYFGG